MMQVNPLRTFDLPDISDHVIHFTKRNGTITINDELIREQCPQQRLASILMTKTVIAADAFGAALTVVCLTESTRMAVGRLIGRDKRYEPCGIAFTKQFIFDHGGGPALYIRGDEWQTVETAPIELRARMVRYWPGATDATTALPIHLSGVSEWLNEREWRTIGNLQFEWSDVAFLIVPNSQWQSTYGRWMGEENGAAAREEFLRIPRVEIGSDGNIVSDGFGSEWR